MIKKAPVLEEALFEVDLEPVFTEKKSAKQLPLFGKDKPEGKVVSKEYKKIPRFQAVIAKDDNKVFSVVTEQYHLITNQGAIALGEQCFKQVFELTKLEDMEFYNLVMPKTRSFVILTLFTKEKHSPSLPPKTSGIRFYV